VAAASLTRAALRRPDFTRLPAGKTALWPSSPPAWPKPRWSNQTDQSPESTRAALLCIRRAVSSQKHRSLLREEKCQAALSALTKATATFLPWEIKGTALDRN